MQSDSGSEAIYQAIDTIHAAIGQDGIYATSLDEENYKRVWARDSTMTGIAGCLINDETIVAGFGRSLDTLATHQHAAGFIPSNVGKGVSYGSLVGRVDSTLWYIIGVSIYHRYTSDDVFLQRHIPHIQRALRVTEAWEFNGRHLLYTPLSGNWADEYPVHGYTLYDNALRLWGLQLWSGHGLVSADKVEAVRKVIKDNFWLVEGEGDSMNYHPRLYEDTSRYKSSTYFSAGFNPSRYYEMWDCAGNAFALLLGLYDEDQLSELLSYIESVFSDIGKAMIPAFWPVIDSSHQLYADLQANYAYSYKNHPYHFHNGGIWPIMAGWLTVALRAADQRDMAQRLSSALVDWAASEDYSFAEYISSDSLVGGGKRNMCYSASGVILSLTGRSEVTQKLL